jgi:nucleotide-binding universal stress UspA family protein
MGKQRRAYEAGHRPKFMAVVDDTPECALAVRFAARRAVRIGAAVLLLAVGPEPEGETWLGVGDVMAAESLGKAQDNLDRAAALVRALTGLEPECIAKIGITSQEIIKLIEFDEDIAILVLAAGSGRDGPGPLVTALAGKMAASFPVPLAIVPGSLDAEAVDALA